MKKHCKNLILLLTSLMLCGCKNKCITPECKVCPEPVEPEEYIPTLREHYNPVSSDTFLDAFDFYIDTFVMPNSDKATVKDFKIIGKETGSYISYDLDGEVKTNVGDSDYRINDEMRFDADLPSCFFHKEIVNIVDKEEIPNIMESGGYKEETDGLFYSWYNDNGEKSYRTTEVKDEDLEEMVYDSIEDVLYQINNGSAYLYYRFRNTTIEEGGKFYIDGNTLTTVIDIDGEHGKFNLLEQIVMDYDKLTFLYEYEQDTSDDIHIRKTSKEGYIVFSLEDIDTQKVNLEEYTLED